MIEFTIWNGLNAQTVIATRMQLIVHHSKMA